jgi:hypothetical protein
MRAPELPPTPKAREAAAVEGAVELIRSKLKAESNDAVVEEYGEEFADGIAEYGEAVATALMVRSTVNAMQDLLATTDDESPFGNRQRNQHVLADAVKHIQALQDTLKKLPAGVMGLIFSTEYEGDGHNYLVNIAEKFHKAGPRLHNFAVALQSLKIRCALFIESPPGEQASADFASRLAAMCAADILEHHGVQPTRGNDGKASTFEQVASLLHEAATGEAGRNLAHACREELKRRRGHK